jgi:hypothetical protein
MSRDDRYVTLSITYRSVMAVAVSLAVISTAVFAYVAIHEITYATAHPHAYGPANIIAAGAGAGALVSIAVALVALVTASATHERDRPRKE